MASGSQSAASRVPRWVIVVAFLVSVCAFGALLLLDEPRAPASPSLTGWVLFLLVAVPGYLLLNLLAEAALEGLVASHRWVGLFLAVALLVVFYVLWFWRVLPRVPMTASGFAVSQASITTTSQLFFADSAALRVIRGSPLCPTMFDNSENRVRRRGERVALELCSPTEWDSGFWDSTCR
jgi:hypothetical protein